MLTDSGGYPSGPEEVGTDEATAEENECQQAWLVAVAVGNLDKWQDEAST